ncbi:MAG: Hsp20/alpha crystallin family protein [Muribaculaceae bacterium]|nr:Hsp20/alpha crystallin family protein [Muribaculaceae bacterium]
MLVTSRTNRNWLPEVFNELFNDNFIMPRTVSNNTPAINVIENKDGYVLELAAPGMTREDLKVTLNEENNLVIDIEKKAVTTENNDQAKETETRYLRHGFSMTKYHQTFILPEDVNMDSITAAAENGILTITLPKLMPEEMKREVKEIAIN